MFEIKVEAQFKADYKRTMRIHPQLKSEFKAAVAELVAHGSLPAEYGAHELSNPGGNYNGHIDFHLSDGLVDVVVLYLPHKTNPVIRLVRMGTHQELFQGLIGQNVCPRWGHRRRSMPLFQPFKFRARF